MILRGWDRPDSITRDDLQGDRFDMQGINWEKLDTTRAKARVARLRLCSKKTNTQRATTLPNSENYFRFGKMNTTHRALISHFQLRNLISCTSRNDIYYASKTSTATKVIHTDASGRSVSCAMDLTSACGDSLNSFGFSITALTASEDVLIAGGFNGEYALTHLSSTFNTPPTAGFVTHEHNGIQNHIHTFSSRSSGKPQGVFCSNDRRLRVLDCDTNQFTYDFAYEQAINCSATSPDGRMRVIVGDFNETLITNAEAGVTFERLRTHTDHVFACAWADDGIHLATGAQDSRIVIWDARRWDHPLITIESEMACPRSLCFSPVGGGKRVLFAAEAQDFVNVIDAVTFDKRQVLDFYGEIGGMTVTPDGSSLFVANCDSKFGGIMEFERVGYGEQHGLTGDMWRHHPNVRVRRDEPWEWVPEHELDDHPLVILPAKARRRRGLGLGDFVI
ncbi:WD40 repeat-like protein [Lepidopterella palustris CBS 459.81]|uniref:WD40 repeat-like protein n=1 Tax=Lepidopterella palustris CBS 459.81 TaxID=1314670 RepID=A0A8E2JD58_9PEZI|nr:WD40 repeat-like protein [Lepidopterella palustris CBS 459.81]